MIVSHHCCLWCPQWLVTPTAEIRGQWCQWEQHDEELKNWRTGSRFYQRRISFILQTEHDKYASDLSIWWDIEGNVWPVWRCFCHRVQLSTTLWSVLMVQLELTAQLAQISAFTVTSWLGMVWLLKYACVWGNRRLKNKIKFLNII